MCGRCPSFTQTYIQESHGWNVGKNSRNSIADPPYSGDFTRPDTRKWWKGDKRSPHFRKAPFWSIFLVDLHSNMIQNMLTQLNEIRLPLHKLGNFLFIWSLPLDVEPATPMRCWSHDWIHSSATLTCHELAASSLQRPAAYSSRSMAAQPAMGVDNGKKGVKSSYLSWNVELFQHLLWF